MFIMLSWFKVFQEGGGPASNREGALIRRNMVPISRYVTKYGGENNEMFT